jgi:hypothetical protein
MIVIQGSLAIHVSYAEALAMPYQHCGCRDILWQLLQDF